MKAKYRILLFIPVVTSATAALSAPVFRWDFEAPFSDSKVINYRDRLVIGTTGQAGSKVLRIANADASPDGGRELDTAFEVESANFDVAGNAEYAVCVRARGTARMQVPTPSPCVAWCGADGQPLKTVDALGKEVRLEDSFRFETAGDRWCTTVVRGIVPTDARSARLILRCDRPNLVLGQWLEVDDVSYYERKDGGDWGFGDLEPPEVERVTPSPCPNLDAAVVFRVTDRSALDLSTFRCRLDGVDITASVTWKGDEFSYHPGVPWACRSLHEFKIAISDAKGNMFDESRFVCFANSCSGHDRGSLRDDGMILVDGKPFFPISVFSVRECPLNGHDVASAVKDLKKQGFNLIASYMVRSPDQAGDYERLISACDDCGMRLWLEPAAHTGANRDREVFEAVLEGRRHPSIFAWCIGDDTATYRTPGDLKRDMLMIKAIDDRVLTSQADACHAAGRYGPYAPYTDVFIPENYPLRGETPTAEEMPAVVRDIEVAYRDLKGFQVDGPRAIVPILQAFSGWSSWPRFPTYEEIRAQTFLSIAARARGVCFYTYWSPNGDGAASTKERYESLCRVSREVASLADRLVSRDAAEQPRLMVLAGPGKDALGHSSVTVLLKESGLLVAASTAFEPVTVRFSFADGTVLEHAFPRNGVLIHDMKSHIEHSNAQSEVRGHEGND